MSESTESSMSQKTLDSQIEILQHHRKIPRRRMAPSADKLLPSLPPGPRAADFTDRRTAHLKSCLEWHAEYGQVVRTSAWHALLKPIATAMRNHKDKRLVKLIEERDSLLLRTDRLASDMSPACGWEPPVAMAALVREMLSVEPEEKDKFLTMWVSPPEV